MRFIRRKAADQLIERLLGCRTQTPSLDLSLFDPAGQIAFHKVGWLSTWADILHVVASPCGTVSAMRGITTRGRLIWLVRRARDRRVYASRAADPRDAIREAETTWRRLGEISLRDDAIRRVVAELRFLRVRHDVTVDDARAAGFCPEGIEAFLRAFGLGRFNRFPGWLIAWLALADRRVGAVAYHARQRWLREFPGPGARSRAS